MQSSEAETQAESTEVAVPSSGGESSFLTDPLVIEVIGVIVLFLLSGLFIRKLVRIAKEVGQRRSLREFIDGMDAFFKKDYSKAIRLLQAVVERDPEHAEARICLGDAHRALGDAAEAHKHHYHVQEVFGHDLLQNHLSLAKDLVMLGKLAEAKEHLTRVLDERSDHLMGLSLLAEVNERLGMFSAAVDARRCLLSCLKGDSDLARERRALARVLARAGSERLDEGDLRRGLPYLEEAVKISPGLVGPRMEMVRAKLIEGSEKGARKVFRQQFKEMKELMRSDEFVFEPSPPGISFSEFSAAPNENTYRQGILSPGSSFEESPDHPGATGTHGPLQLSSADGAAEGGGAIAAGVAAESEDDVGLPMTFDSTSTSGTPGMTESRSRFAEDNLLPPNVESVGEFLEEVLRREAPYHCRKCGRPSARFEEQCRECEAWGTITETDRSYLSRVERLGDVLDEIDENDVYLNRLVKELSSGDRSAGRRLQRAGEAGYRAVFRALKITRSPDPLINHLVEFGPSALSEVTSSFLQVVRPDGGDGVGGTLAKIRNAAVSVPSTILEEGSWLGSKRGRGDDSSPGRDMEKILTRVFLGIGEVGVDHYRRSLDSDSREVRRSSLVALLRFGDAETLDEIPFAVSSKEVIRALNDFDDEVLRGLLRKARPDGHFTQEILTDRTFRRADLFVSHLADPQSAATVSEVLGRRGFSPEVFEGLREAHSNGVANSRIEEILITFGQDASDHLVSTLADPSTSPAWCIVAHRVLSATGPACISRLVENLVGKESPEERRMGDLIVSFADDAIDLLVDSYSKAGKGVLLSRGAKGRGRLRKESILGLLESIGGKRVKKSVKPLLKKETDEDLKRRIDEVMTTAVKARRT